MRFSILSLSIFLFFASCSNSETSNTQQVQKPQKETVVVPVFDGDSAYSFVAKQVSFGPRVPETNAHTKAAEWLAEKLQSYADSVFVQPFRTRLYDGRGIDGKNIIAAFNSEAKKRIVLAAHWDSRPFADYDPNQSNHKKAIDGANDGASGVGVLIELARIFKNNPLPKHLGVDIVLFDLEDYGAPAWLDERQQQDGGWVLGSIHWSRTPHIRGYRASFGILLDMVGAANPVFPQEYFSQQYAEWLSNKVWQKAHNLGYGNMFPKILGNPITDDHLPMNTIAGIPTINIIHLVEESENGSFFEHWHTMNDAMEHIDRSTLKVVGTLVLHVVYNE